MPSKKKASPLTPAKARLQLLAKIDKYLFDSIVIMDRELKKHRPPAFPEMTEENYALLTKTRRDAFDQFLTWLRYNCRE